MGGPGESIVEHNVVEVTVGDAGHGKSALAGNARGLAQGQPLHLRDGDVLSALARTADVDGFLAQSCARSARVRTTAPPSVTKQMLRMLKG